MCYIPGMRPAALVLLLLLGACSPADENARLYRNKGCLQCHGAAGEGGAKAPPLEHLADNWTREELALYLADPLTYVEGDPRLMGLKQLYNVQMPVLILTEEDRLTLADYALQLSLERARER